MDRTVTTTIDRELCIGCGACVKVCLTDTITLKKEKAVVTGQRSLSCGHCAAVCPTGAVQVAAIDPGFLNFALSKRTTAGCPTANSPSLNWSGSWPRDGPAATTPINRWRGNTAGPDQDRHHRPFGNQQPEMDLHRSAHPAGGVGLGGTDQPIFRKV